MAQAELASELGLEQLATRPERGLWSDAFRRLRRNRMAMVALFVLVAVFALAILGNTSETVQRYSPGLDQDYDHIQEGPSGLHYLGTDNLGRDTWARVLEGTLISLQVGLGVQVIVLAIGLLVGGLAALGGVEDRVLALAAGGGERRLG